MDFRVFMFFVVCSSASSLWVTSAHPNCSIFQIAIFGHKRLNSWLNVYEEIKRSRYNKKLHFSFFLFLTFFFTFFCLRCLYLYCLISCKIYLPFIKFLGVLLDENLNWKEHIKYTENKIAKNLGLLYKARPFLERNALLALCYSYIQTYINYANISRQYLQDKPLKN